MTDERYVDRVVVVKKGDHAFVRLVSNNGEILLVSENFQNMSWAAAVGIKLAEQLGVSYEVLDVEVAK